MGECSLNNARAGFWLPDNAIFEPESRPPIVKRYTHQTSAAWTSLGTVLEVTDSTNDELQRRVQSALRDKQVLPEGYSVRADFQRAGRGRLGRQWEARAGENITVSYLLDGAGLSAAQLFTLSQNLALAVRDTIEGLLGDRQLDHDCQVKWPNDVYVSGAKIGGLLVESVLNGDQVGYFIAGIGLNINQVAFGDATQATSLQLLTGQTYDLQKVWTALTLNVQVAHKALRARVALGDTYLVSQRYHEHLLGYQTWNRFHLLASGDRFAARILGVDPRGHLRLEHDGQTQVYSLDEIRWEGASTR